MALQNLHPRFKSGRRLQFKSFQINKLEAQVRGKHRASGAFWTTSSSRRSREPTLTRMVMLSHSPAGVLIYIDCEQTPFRIPDGQPSLHLPRPSAVMSWQFDSERFISEPSVSNR